ncbi:MAG: tRNA (N(6)-L-threonylcarbamoyladenosine(37)-C(2))-methylthiotransferase MtaB [Bacilli bacterium]|nr:tRNA (N(6)-L-threonylcarbamoyladenosine(37)-C(2))-methylthiotransferase MtaB [Bacilli bacterium]
MKTLFTHSLGCKVNSYETNAIAEALVEKGYERVDKSNGADVIILNTCSVTSRADQKSRQHVSRFRKSSPNGILIVMGCHSQKHAQEVLDLGADIVLGTTKRDKIPSLIEEFQKNHEKINMVTSSVRHEEYEELGEDSYTEAARAFLKIQDGCDNFCSYCLIPTLRGNSRSRRRGEVLREAKSLVEKGYKEIVISGIHIGGYGKDLGDGSYTFSDLIEDILKECPALFRLRISSIEESEIDEKLINLYTKYPALTDHIHIPLQSGSSTVLKRMKRKYDEQAFLDKLDALRKVRPDIAITTDVIVGFPGETDEEFEETMAFCRKAEFSEIHVFPFSSRPGTYAASLKDTDPKTKKKRVGELLSLSKELRSSYKKKFYGKEMEVLYEDFNNMSKTVLGHTSNYLLVSMPSEQSRHGEVEKIVYSTAVESD